MAGGLVAAALDISYAVGFSAWRGVPPLRILQSVASGLLGSAAFTGGVPTAALGLVAHFAIVVVAALIYYVASRHWTWMARQPYVAGPLFGLCVYAVMNYVVVPLSAFPAKMSTAPVVVITGLLVHMFFVGLPIALGVRAAARVPDRPA